MKYSFWLIIILLTAFSQYAFSQCLYKAYEGFTGAANTAIANQSSGTGWSAPWGVQNDNSSLPGYQVTNASLSYINLQEITNKMSGGSNYLSIGRRLNTTDGGPFDNLVASNQNGIGTQAGDTLWVSFLLRKEQNNDQTIEIDLHESNLPWYWNSSEDNIGVGYFGSSYHINGQRRWHFRINNTYYDTGIEVGLGTTYLMVMRIAFVDGNTNVSLYVNPTDIGIQQPAAPTLSQNAGQAIIIRSLKVYLGDSHSNGSIDEIRFASSYECVTPDNDVIVNLPPVASFTTSLISGQRPLQINFDGISSNDPEGSGLTYTWNFNDGTPVVNGPSSAVHTFNDLGRLPVSLTVTDNLGLQHTAITTITVLDENNTYPCQTSLTSIQQVSCGQSNGRIRVNAGSNSFTLSNYLNNPMPVTNGNEYHNLASGRFQLYVQGTTSPMCRDTFSVFLPVDSTSCQGWSAPECSMDIGTNMSGFADWQYERPMKNLFKHVREDFIAYSDTCYCWNSNVASQMVMDTSGYPVQIPQTTTAGPNTLVRYVISSEGGNLMNDTTYVLLYDGHGTITFGGSLSILSNTPNRIVFRPNDNGNININISASTFGNHIKNIRILKFQDEFANLISDPFYPVFKQKIAPFKVLRFMDWGNTNGNTNVNWEGRSKTSYFTYAGPKGVPYETMIKLCNETKKDIWICVPHAATDDYIEQMAILFKNQLDPNLNIYLEYSNEIWNWIFPQAHYNNNNRPSNLSYGRAMAQKAGNTFKVWHAIFSDQKCRVKRVLGIQVGFNGLNEEILSHLGQDEWDYGSPTHYFGLDHGNTGNPRLDQLGANVSVDDIMTNAMNSFITFKESVKTDYRQIKLFGKKIITYEGGQHFVGNSFGIPYPYQQAMWDAQNSTQMYNMYHMMHDSIKNWGCELATNFSLASSQESVYGSWGILSHIDQLPPFSTTARKYQAVIEYALTDSCRNMLKWNGSYNTSWSHPCNWDQTRLPDSNSDVIIPSGAPLHPIVNIDTSVKSLTLQLNAMLTVLTGVNLIVIP